jgi:hypothetical protein
MDSRIVFRAYRKGDEIEIVQMLRPYWKHLSGEEGLRNWMWEYEQAPRGTIIKVAEHESGLIGHYALIPLSMKCGEDAILGAKAEGSIVLPGYRGVAGTRFLPEGEKRSIFNLLISEAFETARETGINLIWGFPNKVALGGQVRAGYSHTAMPFSSSILPLNLRNATRAFLSHLRKDFNIKAVADVLFSSLSRTSAFRESTAHSDPGLRVVEIAKESEGVEQLWRSYSKENNCITIERTTPYLRWRMIGNPVVPHTVLATERDNELTGYVATTATEKGKVTEGIIVDMLGLKANQKDLDILLQWAVDSLREKGADFVTAWLVRNRSSTMYREALRGLGFVEFSEPSTDIIIRPFHISKEFSTAPSNWFITKTFTEGVS